MKSNLTLTVFLTLGLLAESASWAVNTAVRRSGTISRLASDASDTLSVLLPPNTPGVCRCEGPNEIPSSQPATVEECADLSDEDTHCEFAPQTANPWQ